MNAWLDPLQYALWQGALMVIDTSVLIAILANEPEVELFEAAIDADPIRLISAASVLEAAIVAGARYGDIGGRELDLLLYKAEIQIVAVSADQVDVGPHTFSKYGKGRHPAALNVGDCFHTRRRRLPASRCFLRATISRRPTS